MEVQLGSTDNHFPYGTPLKRISQLEQQKLIQQEILEICLSQGGSEH